MGLKGGNARALGGHICSTILARGRFCVAGCESSVLKVGHTKFQTSRSRGMPARQPHEPIASVITDNVDMWHGICSALHSSRGLVTSKSIPDHNQDEACCPVMMLA